MMMPAAAANGGLALAFQSPPSLSRWRTSNNQQPVTMSKKNKTWKAVRKGDIHWQLDGESSLRAELEPARPKAGQKAVVRLTHSNGLGRLADADFYVRIGDPLKPTGQEDLDSATDWVSASLVEDLLWIDEREVLRSKETEPFENDTTWWGTYEAVLSFPSGKHSIEIKIVSSVPDFLRSLVLSGWELSVR